MSLFGKETGQEAVVGEKPGHRMSMRTITEAVATISVVLGLLFVGVEIRNNTSVALAESRREATAQNIDFIMGIVHDEALNELWSQEWTVEFVESLSPVDYNKVFISAIALTIRLENVYLQSQQGLLDASAFGTYGMFQPKLRQGWFERFWYETYRPLLDPGFVEYFERANGYEGPGS